MDSENNYTNTDDQIVDLALTETAGQEEIPADMPKFIPPMPPVSNWHEEAAEKEKEQSKFLLSLVLGFVGFGCVCLNVLLVHSIWLPLLAAAAAGAGLFLGHKAAMDFKGICMIVICIIAIALGIYDTCWQISSNIQQMLNQALYSQSSQSQPYWFDEFFYDSPDDWFSMEDGSEYGIDFYSGDSSEGNFFWD